MIRKIIQIDQEKCNGCGLCVDACHEGAIGLVDGKAKLLRDDYCDGLGDCLPACPTNAIAFVEREAAPYDEAAVQENMKRQQEKAAGKQPQHRQDQHSYEQQLNRQPDLPCGCPGSQARALKRETDAQSAPAPSGTSASGHVTTAVPAPAQAGKTESRLRQWPVQIKLVPVNAPYFTDANLLIAADCSAYAYAGFHDRFMKNKVTLIGCPKLDEGDYSEKLTAILQNNSIQSVTVVRMEVPCCGGIEHAVKRALQSSGKFIPWQVVTVSTSGELLD
ncbi:Electron transport complex subunit RsxB [bioreactor metagenome]|uniref:Electron transport complex subunit RsxB n=1 Tax=bioreactor metagenome TaxID=1076179 RepID=A0A645CB46_9ZZZZ